jgi:hypothetical protein
VTDLEQKSEKALAILAKIIMNMTQLEDIYLIETSEFILIHKKSNVSSLPLDIEIENNTFQLPGLINLIDNKNKINDTNQIMLKVNLFLNFSEIRNQDQTCPKEKSGHPIARALFTFII